MNGVIQAVLIIALAPLLQGSMRRARARLQGRPGPSPLQPYRDLAKLWGKEAVVAGETSAFVLMAPGIALGVAIAFAAMIPALGRAWTPPDAVALALLLAVGRFTLVLASLDTRSGFEAMWPRAAR